MKQLKQMCQKHNSAVICFADGQPICSFCDTSQFWVLESCQSQLDDQYKECQNKIKFRTLLLSLQDKFKELIRMFKVLESGISSRINIFADMYLAQDYKFDEIYQLKEMINQMIKNFVVLPKFQKERYQLKKIVSINLPKKYKLSSIKDNFNLQILQPNNLKAKQNENEYNDEQHIQQQREQADQEIAIVNEPLVDKNDNQNRMDILKKIKFYNQQFSEHEFYNTVQDDLKGFKIFEEFFKNKLSINVAPQYLLDLNRYNNFFYVYTKDNKCMLGYSENYKMTGRGIAFNIQYIENGYYINGLLVWGQIFYTKSQDLIIYEEIDNSDDIQTIKQYGSDSILWDRSHYIRIMEYMM